MHKAYNIYYILYIYIYIYIYVYILYILYIITYSKFIGQTYPLHNEEPEYWQAMQPGCRRKWFDELHWTCKYPGLMIEPEFWRGPWFLSNKSLVPGVKYWFFPKILKYSGLWPFSLFPWCQCVYTHQAGRAPALQQNWQCSEKPQNFKEKNTIFIDYPVCYYKSVRTIDV